MAPMRTARLVLPFLLAAATCAAAGRLQVQRERPYDVDLVPRPSTLAWLYLGHRTLAANLTWLRAVQYIGEPRANERGWEKLFPIVDAVTDLDPRHGYAYQVAGTILSSVGRVDESNRILEKGVRLVPDRYILPYLRAFNAFYYDGDWKLAGDWAAVAARTKGAPPHVRHNVLAYFVKGKRADAAVAFLEQSLGEARDPETRKAILSQLAQAKLEQVAAQIDDAVDEWRRRYVAGPVDLAQLVGEGLLPAVPADPMGGSWTVGEDGRVRSSENPYRFARPESLASRPREPGVDPSRYGGLAR